VRVAQHRHLICFVFERAKGKDASNDERKKRKRSETDLHRLPPGDKSSYSSYVVFAVRFDSQRGTHLELGLRQLDVWHGVT